MFWTAIQTPVWIVLEMKHSGTVAAMTAVVGWSYGVAATLIVAYFGNTAAETIITKGQR